MSSKSHSLNLWNLEDSTTKLDIDVSSTKVSVKTTGSQFIEVTPVLTLIDSVGGDIASVSTSIHTLTADLTNAVTVSSTASTLVQSNLDDYKTSNNSALAVVNNTVVSNKAISDANHVADANSRTALELSLETKLDTEIVDRTTADSVLTSSLATEVSNRISSILNEVTLRAAADSLLTTNLASCQSQVDGILSGSAVDLDSFLEVVNSYSTLNTDALAQIASLNSLIVTLTARVDDLTNP